MKKFLMNSIWICFFCTHLLTAQNKGNWPLSDHQWQISADKEARADLIFKNNIMEISYDLMTGSWVNAENVITQDLSQFTGLVLTYQGKGKYNTLELKLIDRDDSTFGITFDSVTAGTTWVEKTVYFDELAYWWNGDKTLDLSMVKLNIAVSKQNSDEGGQGTIMIRQIKPLLTKPENPLLKKEKQTIKIAMCQIFSIDGDRAGNLVRIENALQEAKEKSADITVFPETVILGWVNPDAHKRAYPIPGKDSDYLCSLAKKYRIFICIGLAEKQGDQLYDSAILIDDNGTLIHKHRKMNILTELMSPPYRPGRDIKVVNTKFGRIGVMICADTFGEDKLNRMKRLKPDLVLVPYGWVAEEKYWPQHGKALADVVCKAARIINAPTIGVDNVGGVTHGPWAGYIYGGSSVAADKNGKVIATARDRDRDIKIITIKP